MGKGAFGRVAQQNEKLDLIVVVPNPFHGGFPIDVNGRAGAEENRFSLPHASSLQGGIINLALGKTFLVIKKMTGWLDGRVQLVLMRHLDLWMGLQKIGQRARASFLRARNDKIQLLDRLLLGFKKHRDWSAEVVSTFENTMPEVKVSARAGCALTGKIRNSPTKNCARPAIMFM